MFLKYLKALLCSFPTPRALSYGWNSGSLLGICIVMQLLSGLLLLLNYNALESYEAIQFIVYEVNYGWLLKIFHGNNAGFIFLVAYGHISKNLSVFGYRFRGVWLSGVVILVLLIGAAFTGYALVGSQMSYWAVIVITGLAGVVPYLGETLLHGIWGGYSLSWVTFQTLIVVHFVLPFMVLGMIIVHLSILHVSGSTNLNFTHSGCHKVSFYPYYWGKDIINIVILLVIFFFILSYPYALGEVELYEESNSLSSPAHIMPEWYFLSQYAILRSVPSKGVGVVLIISSIIVLVAYPFSISYITPSVGRARSFFWGEYIVYQTCLLLLGTAPIAQPFILMSQISVIWYFLVHAFYISSNILVTYMYQVDSGIGDSSEVVTYSINNSHCYDYFFDSVWDTPSTPSIGGIPHSINNSHCYDYFFDSVWDTPSTPSVDGIPPFLWEDSWF